MKPQVTQRRSSWPGFSEGSSGEQRLLRYDGREAKRSIRDVCVRVRVRVRVM